MRKTVTLAAAALTALCMMTGASAITDDFTDLTAEDIMAGEVSPDETASYETTDELKTVTIRITGGADGSRYAAYRLLDLVDGEYVPRNMYPELLRTLGDDPYQSLCALDADGAREFADMTVRGIIAEPYIGADYTAERGVFTDILPGYYLIREYRTGTRQDSVSLAILCDAAGNVDISTKEDIPTLEMKLDENGKYSDAADASFGDLITLRLTARLPDTLSDFPEYPLTFEITHADGIRIDTGNIVVSTDESEITGCLTESGDDKDTLTITVPDISGQEITGEEVVVTIPAVLTDEAVCGAGGNAVTAGLIYPINPYGTGTGRSVTDIVRVFTYSCYPVLTEEEFMEAIGNGGLKLSEFDEDRGDFIERGVTDGLPLRGLGSGRYRLEGHEFTITGNFDTESDDPKLISVGYSAEDMSFRKEKDSDTTPDDADVVARPSLPFSGGKRPAYYIAGAAMLFAALLTLAVKRHRSRS